MAPVKYYRHDIDGLRALAVLSVVLYHAGFDLLSGGYVGVDIFFVISGYLITSIIVKEINNDSFSISQFYERRFRRILPALLAMVIVTAVLGAFLYPPASLEGLSKSVVATMAFSSNILFFLESGYFDTASELKPLLHTWSLAVEEQFYIILPLFILSIAKIAKKNYFLPLSLALALSFGISIFFTKEFPTSSFYLLHTRAWELLIGSLLALKVIPELKNLKYRNITSLAGLSCVIFSILTFDEHTVFPGYAALLPTLGAALLIYSGGDEGSSIGRLLSVRPIVFIGLISYSLYLWHWPLIVFCKYLLVREMSLAETFALLTAILVVSVISWHYIEKPFRTKKIFPLKKQLIRYSVLSSAAIAFIGLYVVLQNGLPNRYKWYEDTLTNELQNTNWKKWGECQNVTHRVKQRQELCSIGDVNQDASFLFWGDSHARALLPAIDNYAQEHNVAGKIATQSACPPLLGIERENRLSCHRFNNSVIEYLSDFEKIETVFLSARWALASEGTRFKSEKGSSIKLRDLINNEHKSNNDLFKLGVERTINTLLNMNKKVVIIGPIPEIGFDVPTINFISQLQGRNLDKLVTPTLAEFNARNMNAMSALNNVSEHKKVNIIYPSSLLCDSDICIIKDSDELLYRDDDHLTVHGAMYLRIMFEETL